MTAHELKIDENAGAQDQVGGTKPVPRKEYRVTEKAVREATDESQGSEGIFKNGQLYHPGQTISLDEKTAAGFLELGVVELVTEDKNKEGVDLPAPGTVVHPEGEQNA